MSAEDRAERLIRYVLNAYPPEHLAAETAQAAQGVMRALSSEGLAVVAQEDVLTPIEASALLRATGDGRLPDLDVPEAELSGCVKLRRLSGADQDG